MVVDGVTIGAIDQGLLVLLGVEKLDDENLAIKLLEKLLNYRVFSDDAGKMNLSVTDMTTGQRTATTTRLHQSICQHHD